MDKKCPSKSDNWLIMHFIMLFFFLNSRNWYPTVKNPVELGFGIRIIIEFYQVEKESSLPEKKSGLVNLQSPK